MNELKVILATLRDGDLDTLFAQNVDDFFVTYGEVWRGIKEYYNQNMVMPTTEFLESNWGDIGIMTENASLTPDHYMNALRDEFLKNEQNRILSEGTKMLNQNGVASEDFHKRLTARLAELNKYTSHAVDTDIMDMEAAERHYQDVRDRIARNGGVAGIPTGIKFFDAAYPTGWQPGDLVVVLGYTGRAKSYFTALTACHAYEKQFKPHWK